MPNCKTRFSGCCFLEDLSPIYQVKFYTYEKINRKGNNNISVPSFAVWQNRNKENKIKAHQSEYKTKIIYLKTKIQNIYFQIYCSEEQKGIKSKSNIIFKLPVLPYRMKGYIIGHILLILSLWPNIGENDGGGEIITNTSIQQYFQKLHYKNYISARVVWRCLPK